MRSKETENAKSQMPRRIDETVKLRYFCETTLS
jgi:hypothetical protein